MQRPIHHDGSVSMGPGEQTGRPRPAGTVSLGEKRPNAFQNKEGRFWMHKRYDGCVADTGKVDRGLGPVWGSEV